MELPGDGRVPHHLPTTLLLVNRTSRKGRQLDVKAVVEPLRRRGDEVRVRIANRLEDLTREIPSLAAGLKRLVVAGGDDTVAHFLPEALTLKAAFGIVPCGSANVIASALGIPTHPVLAAAAICEGSTGRYRLTCINGRHVIVASTGEDGVEVFLPADWHSSRGANERSIHAERRATVRDKRAAATVFGPAFGSSAARQDIRRTRND